MHVTLALLEKHKANVSPDLDPPIFVLKFGSSILESSDDLPKVAGEIYRQRRAGRAVVAVVSALAGETDQLLRQAAEVTGLATCRGVPDLVSLGEERTAALLRLACDRIGLRAEICRAEDLGLRTEGEGLNAQPVQLDSEHLLAKLRKSGVVIVPGYVGTNAAGERTLLGRGGSDFSAIFLGGELGADCVRLYKDVNGVFEKDPAQHCDAARYSKISWQDALRIARPLIQPQALEYASARKLSIEVEALGSANPTYVGPCSTPPEPARGARPLRVSIAGFGTVGQSLAERLQREASFEVRSILVRDTVKPRAVAPPVPLTSSRSKFLATPTDIIVDALSCEETGSLLCNALLPTGVHIVSASKRMISSDFDQLARSAQLGESRLLYSAAVGGSATVLETVDRAGAKGEIVEIVGVLNGTVNFILQRLFEGSSFEDALAEAKARGFAEENPEADLSGADAAAKLTLIAHRASGISPRKLAVDSERLDAGSAEHIRGSGERWVQVARVEWRDSGGAVASVKLQPLREVSELPAILNEWNCAAVKLRDGRIYRCMGRGAGGAATAEAIVADLYEILGARTLDTNRHRQGRRQ